MPGFIAFCFRLIRLSLPGFNRLSVFTVVVLCMCPPCYPRKPRGIPFVPEESYEYRLRFCCAEDGCRRRITPPSVRFFGRKVFLSAGRGVISSRLVTSCEASIIPPPLFFSMNSQDPYLVIRGKEVHTHLPDHA